MQEYAGQTKHELSTNEYSPTDKILAIQLGIKTATEFPATSPRMPTEMLALANHLAIQTNATGTEQSQTQQWP